MHKQHLVAPGPTPVPEAARLAMARDLIHHRGPEFKKRFAKVYEQLQWLFQTKHDVLTLACSGTGAFEAAIATFTKRGAKAICVGGGKFGERWSTISSAYGLEVVNLEMDWGHAVDLEAFEALLKQHPDADVITVCACETSTGVLNPIKEMSQLACAQSEALFFVDGITALGVHDLPMDELNIDVMVSGSQKALGLPPGLGFVAANQRAFDRAADSDHARYYFDLRKEKKGQKNGQTAFTPAISLIIALEEILGMLQEEGLPGIFERHALIADATRAGVSALGLELFAQTPSNSVTAAVVPEGVSASQIVAHMRDVSGVIIAGGQDHVKPYLIRIGHLGFYDHSDLFVALSALEKALLAAGHEFQVGSSLMAAQQVFIQAVK